MSRTLLVGVGTEVQLNTATTLSNATVVRVINLSGSDATVKPFEDDGSGRIVYKGDTQLKSSEL